MSGPSLVKFSWRFSLLALGLVATGCSPAGTSGGADASCDGAVCNGGCDTDDDCKGKDKEGPKCDTKQHKCVKCVMDDDCPAGNVCDPNTHECRAGCTATHGCAADGGRCEADAGTCVECLEDVDCSDPARPRCDAAQRRCSPCLPTNDNCGWGTYCVVQGSSYACVDGCKNDNDCVPNQADGGAPGDGGGGNPDGGAPAGPHCDQKLHACVGCTSDDQCLPGKVCKASVCVDGCTDMHGCPMGKSCCNSHCTDTTKDVDNCGVCGNACEPGSSCCGSSCSNTNVDVANCGACGAVCNVMNGTGVCNQGTCRIARCDAGWADCDGRVVDGCEVNINTDAANCGGCTFACNVPHASPKCADGKCAVDTCVAPWFDCDGLAKNGCEINVQASDVNNCGACKSVCMFDHAAPVCTQGACQLGTCNAGWGDCDMDPKTGCEVDLTTTVANCGTCGNACNLAHATPKCVTSQCRVDTCAGGWADCNLVPGDGCEIDLTSSVQHCGACATVCSSNNGVPSCVASACQIACNQGFANCNNNVADGCEINLTNNAANCGGCAIACSSNHVPLPTCGASVCNGVCAAGYADCNNNKQIDGCEINKLTDVSNCGNCGVVCSANHVVQQCGNGTCNGACNAGWADCNLNKQTDGCETDTNTGVNNCGGCNIVCSSNNIQTRVCAGGACTGNCNAGWADCNNNKQTDGCEINTNADVRNCGSCGSVCNLANATPACTGGTCTIQSCNAGHANCDGTTANGCEVNTTTDVNNCGVCGTVCAFANAAPTCAAGVCEILACNVGFADCDKLPGDGCEVDTNMDLANCGACNQVCAVANGAPTCTGGTCEILSCNLGYTDCNKLPGDGCEIHTDTDANNCGGCGKLCAPAHATPACNAGSCGIGKCDAGWTDCNNDPADGCEVNTGGDVNNCGGCNTVCPIQANETAACNNGVCTASCNAGWGDCDGDAATGCETDVLTSSANCGTCGNACPIDKPNCANGSCQP